MEMINSKSVASEREQLAWILFGAATLLAVILGYLFLTTSSKIVERERIVEKERPVEITKIVEREKPVEVIKTVEIEKQIKVVDDLELNRVNAELENLKRELAKEKVQYANSKAIVDSMIAAPLIDNSKPLTGIQVVRVGILIDDPAHEFVDVSRLREMIELRLRSHGVTVEENSRQCLNFSFEGHWIRPENSMFNYLATYTLTDDVMRMSKVGSDLKFACQNVTLDTRSIFGTVGRAKIKDAVDDALGSLADVFVNTYLKSNPKR